MSVLILCEGPACNAGIGAEERQRHYTDVFSGDGQQARDAAYARTSNELRYTAHERVGASTWGRQIYKCQACGHERVYGHTGW